jgi:hypothetical protein
VPNAANRWLILTASKQQNLEDVVVLLTQGCNLKLKLAGGNFYLGTGIIAEDAARVA